MDFDDYIKKAAEFDKGSDLDYYYLGLASEAGEVADIRKRVLRGDREFQKTALAGELGDVLWYVCAIAKKHDLDISYILDYNINKLRMRHG